MFAKYKFSTKLQSAFFLCACITLLVGSIGITGVGRLADALSKTYSEDLIAVSSVGNILSGVTAHNRGGLSLNKRQGTECSRGRYPKTA